LCWVKGYHKEPETTWRRLKGDKELLPNGDVIDRGDIPSLVNDADFLTAFNEWNSYHQFGFPYDGGWKEQPCHLIDIIRLFDSLYDKYRDKKNGSK